MTATKAADDVRVLVPAGVLGWGIRSNEIDAGLARAPHAIERSRLRGLEPFLLRCVAVEAAPTAQPEISEKRQL